jgi:hypothetical protein
MSQAASHQTLSIFGGVQRNPQVQVFVYTPRYIGKVNNKTIKLSARNHATAITMSRLPKTSESPNGRRSPETANTNGLQKASRVRAIAALLQP